MEQALVPVVCVCLIGSVSIPAGYSTVVHVLLDKQCETCATWVLEQAPVCTERLACDLMMQCYSSQTKGWSLCGYLALMVSGEVLPDGMVLSKAVEATVISLRRLTPVDYCAYVRGLSSERRTNDRRRRQSSWKP